MFIIEKNINWFLNNLKLKKNIFITNPNYIYYIFLYKFIKEIFIIKKHLYIFFFFIYLWGVYLYQNYFLLKFFKIIFILKSNLEFFRINTFNNKFWYNIITYWNKNDLILEKKNINNYFYKNFSELCDININSLLINNKKSFKIFYKNQQALRFILYKKNSSRKNIFNFFNKILFLKKEYLMVFNIYYCLWWYLGWISSYDDMKNLLMYQWIIINKQKVNNTFLNFDLYKVVEFWLTKQLYLYIILLMNNFDHKYIQIKKKNTKHSNLNNLKIIFWRKFTIFFSIYYRYTLFNLYEIDLQIFTIILIKKINYYFFLCKLLYIYVYLWCSSLYNWKILT